MSELLLIEELFLLGHDDETGKMRLALGMPAVLSGALLLDLALRELILVEDDRVTPSGATPDHPVAAAGCRAGTADADPAHRGAARAQAGPGHCSGAAEAGGTRRRRLTHHRRQRPRHAGRGVPHADRHHGDQLRELTGSATASSSGADPSDTGLPATTTVACAQGRSASRKGRSTASQSATICRWAGSSPSRASSRRAATRRSTWIHTDASSRGASDRRTIPVPSTKTVSSPAGTAMEPGRSRSIQARGR
ncbi:GPP34 family phosphoprotein [Nakamurella sp. YIM 132084]|uniref:GPP34 family phosphoprotein n=1 Tax=Nakamurella leprariae TaxID=2803911 RepID=A0A938Y5Y2_9ACTN|nr:GPP34 family phosphoprotein [Nakamurella leprariae]